MDDRESDSDALHSCPYLGLDSDPSIRCLFLTSSHRCFRWPTPQPVDYQQQRSYCLSGGFHECSWFMSAADSPSRRRRRASLPMGTGLLSLVAVVAVAVLTLAFFKPWSLLMPASSGQGSAASVSEQAAPPTPAGALSATLSPAASTPLPEGTTQPMAAATSSPRPSPTGATRSAAPTPSSRPAAAATAPRPASTPVRPTATRVATPSGTSGTAAVKIYTVKQGDNLYSLARTFGVTVDDLMKANNLQDRGVLRVGQALVVPSPAQ